MDEINQVVLNIAIVLVVMLFVYANIFRRIQTHLDPFDKTDEHLRAILREKAEIKKAELLSEYIGLNDLYAPFYDNFEVKKRHLRELRILTDFKREKEKEAAEKNEPDPGLKLKSFFNNYEGLSSDGIEKKSSWSSTRSSNELV